MKFKYKVVAVSASVLVLALFLLSVKQYFLLKENLEQQVTHSMEEVIQGISNTVTAQMQGSMNLAALTTGLVSQVDELEDARPMISQPKLTSEFLLIGYGKESSGKYVASDPNWDPGSTWDPRVRPWYKDAKSARTLVVTDPYADAVSGEIVVSIGAPVYKDNNFDGAIFYDVSLAKLGNMINSFNLFDAGFAFMVSSNGSIISHPDISLNGQPARTFLGDTVVRESSQEIEIDGVSYLVMFKAVEGYEWYVGVALEKQKVFSAMETLTYNATVVSIIAVIASFLALSYVINILLKPLEAINSAMSNIARGNADLTVRLQASSEPEFSDLAENFNLFTSRLQNIIAEIQTLGHEVLADAKQTSAGANHATQAIQRQLESLNSLVNSTANMSNTEQQVASTAQQAAEAIKTTDGLAQDGEGIVEQSTNSIGELSSQIERAVDVVNELEVSSSGIEQILSVINGIAEQTNLLALNAAIEAARAGESGRGFAVVADEVRTLAQRTQEATTEIKTMIDQLQSGAENAVGVMKQSQTIVEKTVVKAQETKDALHAIRESIDNIVELNVNIASMLEEQKAVVEAVDHNASEIRNLSNTVVDEAKVVDHTMQSQVDKIAKQEEMLEQFKV
ncbi:MULTISPECIES: methyl-accepting chemotaxis protein [Pseudoalteromonas]|uniref:Methyl-accepting chemotaxis protein n=1 Tax=Pseudoalteromonas luteoviolacea (strain 2ta16) TaxID=1353533 RepID=V4H8F9_PSEL2|nr:methyl-accepting chemotaxis protein [Pseudoalteromonas luteoviolacea]ESP93781.1 methyl-accepting chemotaxis protein [Pseudoalteromonas luteoviolacea 2ta16]KZN41105.1 hypothetical protein N483_15965 [Pseudoalteromonas luteoviolacea NCIMB 1944]MCG7550771.1 methyl-accepting chemotaxis protein [Pseudoalteromonas sp. Of7M-16]